jgi:hypothetical protein
MIRKHYLSPTLLSVKIRTKLLFDEDRLIFIALENVFGQKLYIDNTKEEDLLC